LNFLLFWGVSLALTGVSWRCLAVSSSSCVFTVGSVGSSLRTCSAPLGPGRSGVPPAAESNQRLHPVNGDEQEGVPPPSPSGRGAKVGQGLLFAPPCNCTHLSPPARSCPPGPSRRPGAPPPSHPKGNEADPSPRQRERRGSNRVNRRQRLLPLLCSVINYPQSPGAPLPPPPRVTA